MVEYLSGGRIQGSSTVGSPDTLGSAGDATSNGAELNTDDEKLGTGCLDFDGSEYIVANGLLNAMNTAGSISLWFNAEQDEDAILFAFCATGSNTKLEIATQTTDTISSQLKISGTQQWAVNSTNTYSNTGTWNHIVFTHNGTLPEIYINGTIASMNRSSTTDNTKWWTALRDAGANGIAIGSKAPLNGNTWNEHFEGKLDDIGIWDRVLTSDEVSSLYGGGSSPQLCTTVPSGLKAYYNCDSATVTNNAVITDEKASIADVPTGTRYEETDTRKIYRRAGADTFTSTDYTTSNFTAVGSTVAITSNSAVSSSTPANTANRVYATIPSLKSTDVWSCDFQLLITADGTNDYHSIAFCTNSDAFNTSGQNHISIQTQGGGYKRFVLNGRIGGSNSETTTPSNSRALNIDYYCTLSSDGANTARLRIWTNSNRTGTPAQDETLSIASIGTLTTVMHGVRNSGDSNVWSGTVSNVSLTNPASWKEKGTA